MHIITMMMMSKPVFFTCQHFPDYSLLLSFFLLVAFFGSERRALLNFPFFSFSLREERALFNFPSFLPSFLIKYFYQGGEGSCQFFSFFSFSFFFLIKFFAQGGASSSYAAKPENSSNGMEHFPANGIDRLPTNANGIDRPPSNGTSNGKVAVQQHR